MRQYNFQNLLRIKIINEMHQQFLCNEVADIEMIMALQNEIEEGRITDKEKILDIAFKRLGKEIKLKETYNIPIWHNAELEWFHASFEKATDEYYEAAE